MKKLHRSTTDRMVAGVFGGLGEHFKTDSKILRIAFLIFLLLTGLFPGVIIYFIAVLMIPLNAGVPQRVPHDAPEV